MVQALTMTRRKSHPVKIGNRFIGGDHPIAIQSMTNTATENVTATVSQVKELAEAGSEIVRVTVNTRQAAAAVAAIKAELERIGVDVPLVGDFHYNGHILLTEYPDCARALDKYRINPGNVGAGVKHDGNFRCMIEVSLSFDKPVRIAVNWGSLDQELLAEMMDENARQEEPLSASNILKKAMVASAVRSAERAESYGLPPDRIVLSAKVSTVPDLIDIYRQLAVLVSYPLHLGLTEAGMGTRGIVASASALSVLLAEGIGDTIRVSLTPEPGGSRTQEVEICQNILQALSIRSFRAQVTACPGCGRTESSQFQELAGEVENYLAGRRPIWSATYPGAENLKVAVMGCIVNGPGESRHADIGISLPGTGESPRAPVYVDGKHIATLDGSDLARQFIQIVDRYVEEKYDSNKR